MSTVSCAAVRCGSVLIRGVGRNKAQTAFT